MKNLKYICLLLTGALVFSACEDDDKKPWVLEEVVGNQGAFMRVIDVPSPTFNLFDIPNSEFSIVLEAFDGQDGALVESVSFNVDFIDQTSFNGTDLPRRERGTGQPVDPPRCRHDQTGRR